MGRWAAVIARQFGNPRGVLGRLVGYAMVKGNARFNRWVIRELAERSGDSEMRIAELGPGPGIGLQEALRTFPDARVWGVDASPEMLGQARKRHREQIASGRLILIQGDTAALAELAPLDLVIAVHVLYFWHRADAELARIRGALRSEGALALGYRLRQQMPRMAQTGFPKEGHVLYDSDEQVSSLLRGAGFSEVEHRIEDRPSAAPPGGWPSPSPEPAAPRRERRCRQRRAGLVLTSSREATSATDGRVVGGGPRRVRRRMLEVTSCRMCGSRRSVRAQ